MVRFFTSETGGLFRWHDSGAEQLVVATGKWEYDPALWAITGAGGCHRYIEITPAEAQAIAGPDVDIWPEEEA